MAKKKDDTKEVNTSKSNQVRCIICEKIRRPSDTPMIMDRCFFCWQPVQLDSFWLEWLTLAFYESYSFQPNQFFGEHNQHEVYAKRTARICIASCKYATARDHLPIIELALDRLEARLLRHSKLNARARFREKLAFFKTFRKIVETNLVLGLTYKAVEVKEVVTPLGLSVEVQKTKEKPLMRAINKWKITDDSQLRLFE